MKPVAIFRHSPGEGPGYFATFLDDHSVPWRLITVDEGETVPRDARLFSGLAFMGGPMSVNDPLPWVEQECALIRAAAAADVPVIGHCLGGQLMAKAFGGAVTRNPVKEIGWGRVTIADDPLAREWFGATRGFESFHWHGETFSLPAHARLLMSSPFCDNQCFALGKHLAMQCHVEMTEPMIRLWNRQWAEEVAGAQSPAIQTPDQMYVDMDARLAVLHEVATTIYTKWSADLCRA